MTTTLSDHQSLLAPLGALVACGGRYVLLGGFPGLPDWYDGRDIDVAVHDVERTVGVFSSAGWVIRRLSRYRFQAFLVAKSGARWVTLDVLEPREIPRAQRTIDALLDAAEPDGAGLHRVSAGHLLAWKTVKRLHLASYHSVQQIHDVAEAYRQSAVDDVRVCDTLLHQQEIPSTVIYQLRRVRRGDITPAIFAAQMAEQMAPKRRQRERHRVILDGSLRATGLLLAPGLAVRWLRGVVVESRYPLLAVAVVGNDGSGKSAVTNALKREALLKADPLHIVMRRNEPLNPIWAKARPQIRRWLSRSNGSDNSSRCQRFLVWMVEIADYLDRRVRHLIGRSYARTGLGLAVFERYPTDRIRGEYRADSRSLLPLEQFFPMPDLMLLIDVDPETSLARKPSDGHTVEEMNSKRRNYLGLAAQIDPCVVIDGTRPFDDVLREASVHIWQHCRNLQTGTTRTYPATWSQRPRRRRVPVPFGRRVGVR